MERKFRWILYVYQSGIPSHGADPIRVHSLTEALDKVREFQRDIGGSDVNGSVYGYDAEAWESAQEFAGVGIPFDYPSKWIESGPNGGLHFQNA